MSPIVATSVRELDHLLVRFERLANALLPCTARAAADVMNAESWVSFGYQTRDDFARELLGYSAKWMRKMAALHRAMCAHPELRQAIDGTDGNAPLRRVAAFEICPVLTPETVSRWIEQARQLSVRDLRKLVRNERRKGAGSCGASEKSEAKSELQAESELRSESLEAHARATDVQGEIDSTQTVHMRLHVPPEVHVAFEELHDLHSAVSGRSVSTRDFVEALVAEATAGCWSPLEMSLPQAAARQSQAMNRAHPSSPAQTRRRRAELDSRAGEIRPVARTAAMRRALGVFERAAQAIEEWRSWIGVSESNVDTDDAYTAASSPSDAGETDASTDHKRLHDLACVHMLRTFLGLENEIKIRAADLLADLCGEAPWKALGFAGLADYAQERLGWGTTSTYRRVRLARKTRELESLRSAYEAGRLGVEAATWVVRHLSRDTGNTKTQQDWVHHAESTTVKRLRDEDRMLLREVFLERARVAQDVSRATHAWERGHTEAPSGRRVPSMQSEPSGPCVPSIPVEQSGRRGPSTRPVIPSDAAWRAFIGREPGRSQDLVVSLGLQLVERVGKRGALADLPMGFVLAADLASDLWGCLEAARTDLQARASNPARESAASEARLTPSERIARHFRDRAQPLPHWVGLLALLEDYARTWDVPERRRRGNRDAIHHRDGWRCAAPGCTSRRNLQTHHIQHRARGGGDEAANLQDLCAFHHLRGVHGGLSQCSGRAPLDVVWRLGIPELGAWFRNERRIHPPA